MTAAIGASFLTITSGARRFSSGSTGTTSAAWRSSALATAFVEGQKNAQSTTAAGLDHNGVHLHRHCRSDGADDRVSHRAFVYRIFHGKKDTRANPGFGARRADHPAGRAPRF